MRLVVVGTQLLDDDGCRFARPAVVFRRSLDAVQRRIGVGVRGRFFGPGNAQRRGRP